MWSLRWHFTNKSVAGAPYSIKGYSYSLSHETTHHQLPEAWSKYLHNVFHVAWWWRRGDWYIDVNECELGDPCPGQRNNMTCRNTPGSFSCSCPHGFRFNPRSRHCEGIPDEKDLTGLSQFTQFTNYKPQISSSSACRFRLFVWNNCNGYFDDTIRYDIIHFADLFFWWFIPFVDGRVKLWDSR